MVMDKKEFDRWNSIKQGLDAKNTIDTAPKIPRIKEGEIWWSACGKNIGTEINGKNELFERPILILKKLSQFTFMAMPLTSKEKSGSWYVHFVFRDRNQYAAICQAKSMSVFRLYRKMGMVPKSDLEMVRDGFLKLYSDK